MTDIRSRGQHSTRLLQHAFVALTPQLQHQLFRSFSISFFKRTAQSFKMEPEKSKKGKKSFADIARSAGLKEETISRLIDADFDSIDAIKAIEPDCLTAVIEPFSLGQSCLFKKWWAGLTQKTAPTTGKATTEASEIASIIQSIEKNAGDALWEVEEEEGQAPRSQTPGKPLLIPDFVTRHNNASADVCEKELIGKNSAQLVLRSSLPKPALEEVSLAQWISANARIMQQLISTKQLKNNDDIMEYLDYTADFGDYAQVCEVGSVMIYDNEYRIKHYRRDRKWGIEDVHLANFHLQKKQPNKFSSRGKSSYMPARRFADNAGIEICRNFNAHGCTRSQCKFSHVCSICKEPTHSKLNHH